MKRRALRWQFCWACKGVGNEVYQDAAEKQAVLYPLGLGGYRRQTA